MVNAGRKATLVLLANTGGAVLGYVALLLIGRYFHPASYGAYLFAFGMTGLFALVSTLGLGTAHQRHVAQGLDPGVAMGVLVRLRLLTGAAAAALFFVAYWVWTSFHEEAITDASTPLVVLLVLALQMLSAARQVLLDTWVGQQRVHRVEVVRLIDTALSVLLLANAAALLARLQGRWEVLPWLGAFWSRTLGMEAAPDFADAALLLVACYLLAKLATLLLAWLWSLRDRVRLGPWNTALALSYVRLALPFALMGALTLVLQYTDSIMLGFFWTSNEVGLYGAAQRLAGVALLASLAVSGVLFPRFAQLRAQDDPAREAATHAKAERYLGLLCVPLAAAMVALPREGLHVLVGDAYLAAAGPLRILAAWAVVATFAQPLLARFMAAGNVRVLLRATALNAGGNALLNLLFIPEGGLGLGLGPTGAALATLLSTLIVYAYLRVMAHRRLALPWASPAQARIVAAGLLLSAALLGARDWLGPGAFARVWHLAGWGLAGLALYVVALLALRELHGRDLEFLRKVAHPRALLAELRGR
jgi:O-antigen/teichoic acid export membrane protein